MDFDILTSMSVAAATGVADGDATTGVIAGVSAASLLALIRAVVAIIREMRAWKERKRNG